MIWAYLVVADPHYMVVFFAFRVGIPWNLHRRSMLVLRSSSRRWRLPTWNVTLRTRPVFSARDGNYCSIFATFLPVIQNQPLLDETDRYQISLLRFLGFVFWIFSMTQFPRVESEVTSVALSESLRIPAHQPIPEQGLRFKPHILLEVLIYQ